jgi:hypothetical protein
MFLQVSRTNPADPIVSSAEASNMRSRELDQGSVSRLEVVTAAGLNLQVRSS